MRITVITRISRSFVNAQNLRISVLGDRVRALAGAAIHDFAVEAFAIGAVELSGPILKGREARGPVGISFVKKSCVSLVGR